MRIHGTAEQLRGRIEHAKAQWQTLMADGMVDDAMELSLRITDLRYELANVEAGE